MLQAHYDLTKVYAILGRKAEEQAEIEQVRTIRERFPGGDEDPVLAPDSLLGGYVQDTLAPAPRQPDN